MNFLNLLKSIYISVKHAIISNPDLQRIRKEHPNFFTFLRQRLSRKDVSGLFLTLAILIAIYILFLFFGLIQDILNADPIALLDVNITSLLYTFRNPVLVDVFFWLTLLGNWQIILSVFIVSSIMLWLWQKKNYLAPFWLGFLGNNLFVYLTKLIVHRPRLQEEAVYLSDSFSFPSGHAALSFFTYGFLAYILIKEIKSKRYKILTAVTSFLLIAIIGFSRLYLGMHLLSDVLAGFLSGAFWLLVTFTLFQWLQIFESEPIKKGRKKKLKIITLALILFQIIFFLIFAIAYNPAPNTIITKGTQTINEPEILNLFQGKNALPQFTETPTGKNQEPLNFIIITPDIKTMIKAFEDSNWYLADPPTLQATFRLIDSAILNQEYTTAPLTPSFWNSQVNSYGFEKPTDNQTVRQRHHARFWSTDYVTETGQMIFVGTASLDQGLKWFITHQISPDIDTEREYIFNDLQKANKIKSHTKEQFIAPKLGQNFSGDMFFTDGQIYVLNLK